MQPRYFAGELLYVNPNRPITPNCFVAVEFGDGRGLVRQFLRRTHDAVFVRKLHPDQEAEAAGGGGEADLSGHGVDRVRRKSADCVSHSSSRLLPGIHPSSLDRRDVPRFTGRT